MQNMHKTCKICIIDSVLNMQNNLQNNMQPICNLICKICIFAYQAASQNKVHCSCSVIRRDVGFVCPARSFGVDKVYLSQYLNSLFAYFLLGPSEMLASGHFIFQSSSRGQSKNSVLMQLSMGL